MSDAVEIPSLDTDLGRELIIDCARFAEGLLDEKAIRKKFRFDAGSWEALGSNEELIKKIEAEKLRRVRNGQQKRERAQQLIVKAPDVLGGIMNDVTANARHRINSVEVLNDLAAASGPGVAAEGPVFEIFINLGADQEGKPIVEHYRKPLAIGASPSGPDDNETNDDDVNAGVVAALAMKKSEDGGNGGKPV